MLQIDKAEGNPKLLVDGIVVAESSLMPGEKKVSYFHIYDEQIVERICEHTFEDLPSAVAVWMNFTDPELPLLDDIFLCTSKEPHSTEFRFRFDWENWKERWTIVEFCKQLAKSCREMWRTGMKIDADEEMVSNGFDIIFASSKTGSIIADINRQLATIRELHQNAIAKLIERADGEAVVIRLKLPKEIRVPCEQYLLYFGEFLSDIGVEAKVGIDHRHEDTIFSVVPASKEEALDKIRRALDVYLIFPTTSNSVVAANTDIAVQQLLANIHHLQGQIALKNAVIEMKDATIRAERRGMVPHLPDLVVHVNQNTKSDEEKVLGGVLIFNKADTKLGIAISLAEVVRKLRSLFAR